MSDGSPAADPGGPVIDAHQHFWDPPRTPHPWLSTAPLASFRYGDYAALRRPYLPADFRRDAGPRVVATVHVEAEWDTADEVGETRWLAELRRAHGLPTVSVGHARFEDPGVDEVLAGHARFDFVRGIRQKPAAVAAPAEVRRGAPDSMDDPTWRRGYALLERHGLHFELQTPWWHLEAAAELARDFPRIPMVVNHTGLPADRGSDALAAWQRALDRVAARPNVSLKISGLGLADKSWPRDGNRRVIGEAISIFGADRCMFASNFPVDSLCVGYATLLETFERAIAGRPQAEQRALRHDNAARIYRIPGI